MKNKIIFIEFFLFALLPAALISSQRNETASQSESGAYIETDAVTVKKLQYMPVPRSRSNYALYQSIGTISNIVIGNFNTGDPVIILIQDRDSDEKPDTAAAWNPATGKLIVLDNPDQFCPVDKFKLLKEAVFGGRQEKITLGDREFTIAPNENLKRFESLGDDNIIASRHKQGLRVAKTDPDDRTSEMEIYSYSNNDADGSADIAFSLRYFYRKNSRESPLISFGVYCSKSYDPFAKEKIKQLREIGAKYSIR